MSNPRSVAGLGLLLLAATMAAGCAAAPDTTAYEIIDARVRWLDRYETDRRECTAAGGYIVQERHHSDRLRIGDRQPESGTRYWCSR